MAKTGAWFSIHGLARALCLSFAGGALLAGCVTETGESGSEEIASTYRSFEEFEAATSREAETGYYIVDGDIPIYTREQLLEFYEQHVAQGQLIVHTVNGVDARWEDKQKLALTYCVSTGFGSNYAAAAKAMNDAAAAWSAAANVRFIHMTDQDGACTATNNRVMFDVRPVSGQAYLARAFFPDGTRDKRNVLIDSTAFTYTPVSLTGILRHELGHTIGFRHEHTRPNAATCFEDNAWRDMTSYDSSSVMHYPQCNGTQTGDLVLTDKDKLGAASLYGRRQGGAQNLAYLKGASQSSNFGDALAARAVDGNVDGDFNHRSVSHTNGEASPWWQVDLGSVQAVGDVILHNRTDGSVQRLSNFKLLVSKDGTTWRTINYPGMVGARAMIPVSEAVRYVKVQLNADGTTRFLHLGEVEVLEARNLAKGRAATQSSTYSGGEAARAVDGNTNGNWYNNSTTHTNAEVSPWWQVDLGAIQPIGQVVLYNRTDCCSDRLSNFKLMVSNDGITWSPYAYGANTAARLAFDVNRTGRYVKVQLDNVNNTARHLSLAEVEVLAGRNLALGKTASQSSNFEFKDGNASKAIDGITDGDFSNGSSTTHVSANGELAPWWQVDLGSVSPVGEVVLYNRTDCCSERLVNFKLQTSLDGTSWADVQQVNTPVGLFLQIPTNRPARYVRVQFDNLGTARILHLAEVEVLAARNLSLVGIATQSSTYLGGENVAGDPSRAVDGNTDGDFTHKSVSHTNNDAQAFWRLDLGSVMPIGEVYLYNRTDGSSERLSNFKVQISEDGTTYKDFQFPGQASWRESFKTKRIGRYVRVQLNGTNFLQLAEVEAYLWN